MGNRSYLYLVADTAEENEAFEQVAEANNSLPLLWRILLAGGNAVEPIRYQRVFGDADSPNLSAPAAEGLARLRRFLEMAALLPDVSEMPSWQRYADACVQHLEALLTDAPDAWFSANIDEWLWLDSGAPEEAFERVRGELAQFWADMERAFVARNLVEFESLVLKACPGGMLLIGTPDFWLWEIGFGNWDHPYFQTDDFSRGVDFADWHSTDEDLAECPVEGCEVFSVDGRVGLRDAESRVVLLAPEFDEITPAAEALDTENELVRACMQIRKGERWGLASVRELDGLRHAVVTFPPALESLYYFAADGLAVAVQDGLHGFLRVDGRWQVMPAFADAWDYSCDLALVQDAQGAFGYIDRQGAWFISPGLRDGGSFEPSGLARVQTEAGWGVIDRAGSFVIPAGWQELEFLDSAHVRVRGEAGWGVLDLLGASVVAPSYTEVDELCAPDTGNGTPALLGWYVTQGGRRGVLRSDGSAWIPVDFDHVNQLLLDSAIIVERGGMFGLFDWAGNAVVACDCREIEPFFKALFLSAEDEAAAQLPAWFGIKRGKFSGVVDVAGQEIVPLKFHAVETALLPLEKTPANLQAWRDHVLVTSAGKKALRRMGVWSVAANALSVPCAYHKLWPFSFAGEGGWQRLFLSFDELEDVPTGQWPERVGVLREDGTPLFAADYAWLHKNWNLGELTGYLMVRGGIAEAWAEGQPVEAMRALESEPCWLYADGREASFDTVLTPLADSGDVAAAWRLGEYLWARRERPGFAERAFAHLQVVVNCGQRETPGTDYQEACWRLAWLLHEGEGVKQDYAEARRWLEAGWRKEAWSPLELLQNLAWLYEEGLGGAENFHRARELFEKAAEMGSARGAFHAARMWSEGLQGQGRDLEKALALYKQAQRGGEKQASAPIAALCCALARDSEDNAADWHYATARAEYRKALEADPPEEERATIELALAELLLDGRGGPPEPQAGCDLLVRAGEAGNSDAMRLLLYKVFNAEGCLPSSVAEVYWQKKYYDAINANPVLKVIGGLIKFVTLLVMIPFFILWVIRLAFKKKG